MTSIAVKGDRRVAGKTHKRESWWNRKNNIRVPQFQRAVQNLQDNNYVTELWVDKKKKTITLRWARKGSQWHVTAHAIGAEVDALKNLANHALMWLTAVDRNQGNEGNYAVREV